MELWRSVRRRDREPLSNAVVHESLFPKSSVLECAEMLILAILLSAPPDVHEVIRGAVTLQKAQDNKNWKFTWRQDYEQIDIDKNGKVFGKNLFTSEVIMLEGSNYTKLVSINGKPLDEKMQKKVDQE